tara:strand:+ start:1561 stop:1776 length:216 start_codon:yes stop_codon:yes gene_type:complete
MKERFFKTNKIYILIVLIAFLIGIFANFDSADIDSNKEVIEEGFNFGRLVGIGILIGGWNLINHYFIKDKK